MSIVRYRFGDYVLDLPKHELLHRGVPVALQARVFECLCCLVEHRDRAVSRDELVQAVFGRLNVSDAQLAQVVLRSRRAIGDDGHEQHSIRTVPRYGFRWLPPVMAEGDASGAAAGDDAVPVAVPEAVEPDAAPGLAAPAAERAGPPAVPVAATGAAQAVATGSAAAVDASRRRRRRFVAIAVPAALALLLVASTLALRHGDDARAPIAVVADADAAPRALLVLPTAVRDPGDASWARLGLMDYIGDRLRRGGLPVLSSETALGMLHGQDDDPRRLRRAAKVKWIVDSRAAHDARGWEVRLQASGEAGPGQRAVGRDADLLRAARQASDRLSAALGGRAAPHGDAPDLAERLQRARAAMLANRIEAARRILLDAPELQRAQPQLRYQLARVDFRAGDYARGLSALDELLAGGAARGDAHFRAQLLNARGAMLVRLDRAGEAQRSYDEAIAATGGGQPAELGIALSGRAVANALQQRFDRALADFGQARVQLAAAGDALAVARVDANLGILEVDRGHPAQALPYLDRAARDFDAMGAVNELSTLRNMRVVALLQLLRHEDAMAESERAWALLPRLRDPTQRADTVLTRAQALLEAGRLRDAAQVLAMPEAGQSQPSELGRREALQAELALRGGAPARAVAIADAALGAWPAQRNPRVRGWLRLRREQAALQADLAVSIDADALGDSVPDRLARATAQRARGEAAAADAGYRSALALAEERGIPAEIAAAVVAHADWLLDRGRAAEASALVGRVAPWAGQDFDLAVLQARLLRALGQDVPWRAARERAAALAGERTLPGPDAAATTAAGGHGRSGE